nr:hypothetical protein Iba_chr02cCG1600 [Ipomoea batatas]
MKRKTILNGVEKENLQLCPTCEYILSDRVINVVEGERGEKFVCLYRKVIVQATQLRRDEKRHKGRQKRRRISSGVRTRVTVALSTSSWYTNFPRA